MRRHRNSNAENCNSEERLKRQTIKLEQSLNDGRSPVEESLLNSPWNIIPLQSNVKRNAECCSGFHRFFRKIGKVYFRRKIAKSDSRNEPSYLKHERRLPWVVRTSSSKYLGRSVQG